MGENKDREKGVELVIIIPKKSLTFAYIMQLTGTIQERVDAAISPLQIMQDNTPDYWNETTLPEIIQFVEE